MKKHLFSTIFLAVSISGYAQTAKTGIGTNTPQQTLHVVGATATPTNIGTTGEKLVKPTVRVEGLNGTNNTANPNSPDSLKRVYANQNGDLVLVKSNLEQQNISQEFGDVIPTVPIIGTVGLGDFQETANPLKTKTFILTQPSVVYFSASFAAVIREGLGITVTPTDNRAKLFGAYYRFSTAPGAVSKTATFGNNKKTYVNGPTLPLLSSPGVNGNFVLNPRAKLVLPAGTYTVELYGQQFSSALGLLFTVEFGNGGNENFIINAIPVQYQ